MLAGVEDWLHFRHFKLLGTKPEGPKVSLWHPRDTHAKPSCLPSAGETKPGWGWFTYGQAYGRYAVANQGPGSVPATCVQLTKDGGLSFTMKGGNKPGLQPFAGVTAISVWLKSDAQAQDAAATSTPSGQVSWRVEGLGGRCGTLSSVLHQQAAEQHLATHAHVHGFHTILNLTTAQ
jgi:hypothetical protein